jgi:hypothetical protein
LNNQRIAFAVTLPIGRRLFILWRLETPLCLVRHPPAPLSAAESSIQGSRTAGLRRVHRHHEAACQRWRDLHEFWHNWQLATWREKHHLQLFSTQHLPMVRGTGRSFPASASCLPLPLACPFLGKSGTWFSSSPTPTFAPLSWLCCGEGVPHILSSLQSGALSVSFRQIRLCLRVPPKPNVHICRTHSQPRCVSMTDTRAFETCCARLLCCTSQKHNYLVHRTLLSILLHSRSTMGS